MNSKTAKIQFNLIQCNIIKKKKNKIQKYRNTDRPPKRVKRNLWPKEQNYILFQLIEDFSSFLILPPNRMIFLF